jgi:hypothetical protein
MSALLDDPERRLTGLDLAKVDMSDLTASTSVGDKLPTPVDALPEIVDQGSPLL